MFPVALSEKKSAHFHHFMILFGNNNVENNKVPDIDAVVWILPVFPGMILFKRFRVGLPFENCFFRRVDQIICRLRVLELVGNTICLLFQILVKLRTVSQ